MLLTALFVMLPQVRSVGTSNQVRLTIEYPEVETTLEDVRGSFATNLQSNTVGFCD